MSEGMKTQPLDEAAREGRREQKQYIPSDDQAIAEKLKGCPVQPIGHSKGYYFFISPAGEIRQMRYNEFKLEGLTSLFEGKMKWLYDHFASEEGGVRVKSAMNFLIRACGEAGLYDPHMHIRLQGVWRGQANDDGPDGLVVHCGDKLLIDGETVPAGRKIGSAIYEASTKITPPADTSATAEDGQFLRDTLALWAFERGELDAVLMTGFIAQAMLGAAHRWRAHIMVTAPSGSGKSWLADTVGRALGAAAHDIKNDFTEAHLRQSLNNQARCMLLDEAEPDEYGRVKKVVEMLRKMSGGDGQRSGRGSAGGQSQSFSATGSAYLSSIFHTPLSGQDKSRILHVHLKALGAGVPPDRVMEVEKRMKHLKAISPALRRRMIDGWPRFLLAFEKYHSAFLAAKLSSRYADLLATVFAGKEVMLNDHPPHSDAVDDDIDGHSVQKLISELSEQLLDDNEGAQCLNHLYSSRADSWRGGEMQTVGQLIIQCMDDNDRQGAIKKLSPYGLRYEPPHIQNETSAALIIANDHVGLEKIFHGTKWAGKVWTQALDHLNCEKPKKPYRFGGTPTKARIIPEEWYPKDDD